jgi:hypothetical protein
MMSRTSRMLKWIGAGTVLLAAAPIAWAGEPSRPQAPKPVVVPETHQDARGGGRIHPAFHGTCPSRQLTVPHSTQAR